MSSGDTFECLRVVHARHNSGSLDQPFQHCRNSGTRPCITQLILTSWMSLSRSLFNPTSSQPQGRLFPAGARSLKSSFCSRSSATAASK